MGRRLWGLGRRGGSHVEDAVVQVEQRDVQRASAHVVDHHAERAAARASLQPVRGRRREEGDGREKRGVQEESRGIRSPNRGPKKSCREHGYWGAWRRSPLIRAPVQSKCFHGRITGSPRRSQPGQRCTPPCCCSGSESRITHQWHSGSSPRAVRTPWRRPSARG